MSRFRAALQSGRVLLMDGAMGTELQRANLQPGECGEFWNLAEPERVQAIHQAYVDAGASSSFGLEMRRAIRDLIPLLNERLFALEQRPAE